MLKKSSAVKIGKWYELQVVTSSPKELRLARAN